MRLINCCLQKRVFGEMSQRDMSSMTSRYLVAKIREIKLFPSGAHSQTVEAVGGEG